MRNLISTFRAAAWASLQQNCRLANQRQKKAHAYIAKPCNACDACRHAANCDPAATRTASIGIQPWPLVGESHTLKQSILLDLSISARMCFIMKQGCGHPPCLPCLKWSLTQTDASFRCYIRYDTHLLGERPCQLLGLIS